MPIFRHTVSAQLAAMLVRLLEIVPVQLPVDGAWLHNVPTRFESSKIGAEWLLG
ncbi:MAG: hypothetical protein ACKVP5_10215 [Aestuariivirga sp.]